MNMNRDYDKTDVQPHSGLVPLAVIAPCAGLFMFNPFGILQRLQSSKSGIFQL